MNKDHDPVNHPSHYTNDPSGVECITITRHQNFNRGNAIKYVWRAGLKDPSKTVEDLRKAIFYIEDEIKRLEGDKSGDLQVQFDRLVRESTQPPAPIPPLKLRIGVYVYEGLPNTNYSLSLYSDPDFEKMDSITKAHYKLTGYIYAEIA